MGINTKTDIKPYSLEHIANQSFDSETQTTIVQALGFDGVSLQRPVADAMAVKIQTGSNVKYIGLAKPGTAQATAKWQAFKVDTSSGTVITFADGDSNFDNTATDLSALTYS